jgi:hypothetical protein
MSNNKFDLCARAYLEYYRSQFKKYAWACDYAEELIQKDPKASLEFVIELLTMCQNEQEIAYIASGPLEDLLHHHLFDIQHDIEEYLQNNAKMLSAIRYVWAPDKSPVHSFLKVLSKKSSELTNVEFPNLPIISQTKVVDE